MDTYHTSSRPGGRPENTTGLWGRSFPKGPFASQDSSSRHPCPPVLPQGNFEQLGETVAGRARGVKAILAFLMTGAWYQGSRA